MNIIRKKKKYLGTGWPGKNNTYALAHRAPASLYGLRSRATLSMHMTLVSAWILFYGETQLQRRKLPLMRCIERL